MLSAERLGAGLTAIVEVSLDRQASELLTAFEKRAAAEPCVQQCYRVSSGPDFILIVQVSDMEAYQGFANRLLNTDANVRTVRSFFSQHRAKFSPAISLPGCAP